MSEAQSVAAKEAWARRREQAAQSAANAAEAMADSVPDDAVQAMTEEITASASVPEEAKPAPKADHSQRMAMLDEIRKAREAEEASDTPTHEEPPPDAQVADVSRETPATPDAPAIAAAPVMVKAKVDGQEFNVPQTEIDEHGGLKAYQINKAAENRLHKASEFQKQQAELTARMQAQYEALRTPVVPQKPVAELIKEKIAQVQFGTPDEAAAAIDEIIAAKVGPTPDPAKMQQDTVDMVFRNMAAQAFVGRSQDLIQDQITAQLAVLTENDMLRQGKPSDWRVFYANLESNLRNRLGKPPIATPAVQPTNPSPNGSVAAKEARKASIVDLPVASARAATPEEPKPKTREELIAQMR